MKLSEHLRAVCLIQRPIAAAEAGLSGFLSKYGAVQRSELVGLRGVAEYLTPLVSFATRHVLVPHGDWTLLVDNRHGGMSADLGVVLSTRLGTVVVTSSWRDTARFWTVIDGGETRRAVSCYQDGDRWVFHQQGTPLRFEDTTSFASRKTTDRFPPSAVQHAVHAMSGLAFPIDWRQTFSSSAIGLERSTAKFKEPVAVFPTENDL